MLTGYKGSGKDTIADILNKKYGFEIYTLASSLKIECTKKYNIDINYFYDRKLKDKVLSNDDIGKLNNMYNYQNKTPRDLLLDTSKEIRKINPLYFCKKIEDKINLSTNKYIVITDMRLLIEKIFINKYFLNVNKYYVGYLKKIHLLIMIIMI